jgi:hypothetical protein
LEVDLERKQHGRKKTFSREGKELEEISLHNLEQEKMKPTLTRLNYSFL